MKKMKSVLLCGAFITSLAMGVEAQTSLTGKELNESGYGLSRGTEVIRSNGASYRSFSLAVNNYNQGASKAFAYQAFQTYSADNPKGGVYQISTSFQALQEASLLTQVADSYVDGAGNTVTYSLDFQVTDENGNSLQVMEGIDKRDGTYYGSSSLGSEVTGFSASEFVQMALVTTTTDADGNIISEERDYLDKALIPKTAPDENGVTYNRDLDSVLRHNGGTGVLDSYTDVSKVTQSGWYTRNITGVKTDVGDNVIGYRDVVYVADGRIIAVVEARPVAETASSPSGAPLPGVWATLALCGVVGGYLKRRRKTLA